MLIRHAESTWNAEGRWQGQADPPLSPEGVRQAESLAHALGDLAIEHVVASDLRRAADTARIVAASLRASLSLDPRLREHDVGVWSGLRHDEISARWPGEYARFRSGDLDLRFGGAESRRELRQRVRSALAAIRSQHAGKTLALVTHAGVVRALDARLRLDNADFTWWDTAFVDAEHEVAAPLESR